MTTATDRTGPQWVPGGHWEWPAESTGTGQAERAKDWELKLYGLSPDGPAPEPDPEPAPVVLPQPSEMHVGLGAAALDLLVEALHIGDREAVDAERRPVWKERSGRAASRHRGAESFFADLAPSVYVGCHDADGTRRREGREVGYVGAPEGSHAHQVATSAIALGDLNIPREYALAVIRRMWRMLYPYTSYVD